jgi:hypothetical protein
MKSCICFLKCSYKICFPVFSYILARKIYGRIREQWTSLIYDTTSFSISDRKKTKQKPEYCSHGLRMQSRSIILCGCNLPVREYVSLTMLRIQAQIWCQLVPKNWSAQPRYTLLVQLENLVATIHGKLRSGRAGPFVKVEGCCD